MDIDLFKAHIMITTFTLLLLLLLLLFLDEETEQQIEIFASMNIERTR